MNHPYKTTAWAEGKWPGGRVRTCRHWSNDFKGWQGAGASIAGVQNPLKNQSFTVGGTVTNSDYSAFPWVSKYDSVENLLWDYVVTSDEVPSDYSPFQFRGLDVDPAGYVYVTGGLGTESGGGVAFRRDMFIMKLAPDGSAAPVWPAPAGP